MCVCVGRGEGTRKYMRILQTLSVVGMNTPVIVPSFSARAGFSGFVSGVTALLLHFVESRFQKLRRRVGVWDSMLVPVVKGPDWDGR